MSIQYVLFDFDGTLVDSNEAVVSILHLASVKHRGIPFSEAELNEILGKPINEQMSFLSVEKEAELVEFYRTEYRKVRDALTKAYVGVDELLSELKASGAKIGIVSNKGRNGIDHGLELMNMAKWIDVSISKDDVVETKPHPEGIFKALNALGGSESDLHKTVFIGDSGHDIECGKNAGCHTVLVKWTLIDLELLKKLKPDYIAETPHDILEFIRTFDRQTK